MNEVNWQPGRELRSLNLTVYSDQTLYVYISSEAVFHRLFRTYSHLEGIDSLLYRMAMHEIDPASVRLKDASDWRDGSPSEMPRELRHELADDLHVIMKASGLEPFTAHQVMATAMVRAFEWRRCNEF
ncbi:hypothetical protein ACERNI_10620 [Camelimonas sp. ID_303_24]